MKFKSLLVALVAGLICFPFVSTGADLSVVRQKAEQGDAEAQNGLGNAYYWGKGVPQDYIEAAKWYRLAAEQGYATAQDNLGNVYYWGKGVPQDYIEAAKWYRRAAEEGHAAAQNNLGSVYYSGIGVPQDYEEAAKWYRLAAEQGHDAAQFNLGNICCSGRGVPRNYEEAVKWYRLAAEQRYAKAQFRLGYAYDKGKGVPQNYAKAAKWYRLAAEQGHTTAQNNLGCAYEYGRGVPQDYIEAAKWYRLAAEQGHDAAQSNLGNFYNWGKSVPQDYIEAVKWYRLAAEQGYAAAQFNLGYSYDKGEGVPQNYAEAAKWYRLAAEQGYAEAQNYLRLLPPLPLLLGDLSSTNGIIASTNVSHVIFPDYALAYFEAEREKAVSGSKQDRDDYFNVYASYVKGVYDTFQNGRVVARSYRSRDEIKDLRNNYALELENFFNKTTTPPVSPDNGAFVKTKEGLRVEICKIYSYDTNAVFIKDGTQNNRVPVSDLDPSSRQLAEDLIVDQLFNLSFDISVRELDGRKWEDPGITISNGARESFTYKATPYSITLENRSDLPIDNLIVEYQIFFKQTLAGTSEGSDDYYRFTGHSIVKAVPAKDKIALTVNPPAIKESELHGRSSQERNTLWDYYIIYPKGDNQKSFGRMQGSWVRVHRITPYGRLTRELKNNIYPNDAEWGATEMLYYTTSPFFFSSSIN